MNDLFRPARAWGRAATWLLLAATALLTGCASVYVDGGTREVPVTEMSRPAQPVPVQMVFEFQTKGTANAAATNLLKEQVVKQVRDSGLFASVVDTPVPGGALLSVTLNNVPVTDDAFTKGFVTGFTFGLVGSSVTDGYICTLRYTPAGGGAPVQKAARHALHTSIGAGASPPPDAVKADTMEGGVRTMTRQVVSNVLADLARDPAFGGAR